MKALALLLMALLLASLAKANPFIPDESLYIDGLYGSYANFILKDGVYYFFSNKGAAGEATAKNCPGQVCPGLVMFQGTSLTNMEKSEVVFSNSRIFDVKNPTGKAQFNPMIGRPVVKYSKLDRRFYALVHVSAGYLPSPYNNRVYPALLRSNVDDPTTWTYLGQLQIKNLKNSNPSSKGPWCSGQTFFVNDNPSKKIDQKNPMHNRFVIFEDCLEGGGARGLKVVYTNSLDGKNAKWEILQKNGKHALLQPPELQTVQGQVRVGETWIFASAVETRNGYYMTVTGDWAKNHGQTRLLFSENGYSGWSPVGAIDKKTGQVPWDSKIGGQVAPKNVNLSYSTEDNLLYLIISTWGSGGEKSIVGIRPPQ